MTEITKELFNHIICNSDVNIEVIDNPHHRDVFFSKFGVKLMYRTQNGYTNYYIQDINK